MIKKFLLAMAVVIAMTGIAQAQVNSAPADKLVLETNKGKVVIALRPDLAPNHVARIKELTNQGFYNGIVFHRVVEGFMAQTGDPTGTGMGGSKLPDLKAEFTDTPFVRGTVGMARAGDPNSANSQFFITFGDASFLNGQYTVWGQVVEGMEVVDSLKKGPDGTPITDPDKIVKATIVSATPVAAAPAVATPTAPTKPTAPAVKK